MLWYCITIRGIITKSKFQYFNVGRYNILKNYLLLLFLSSALLSSQKGRYSYCTEKKKNTKNDLFIKFQYSISISIRNDANDISYEIQLFFSLFNKIIQNFFFIHFFFLKNIKNIVISYEIQKEACRIVCTKYYYIFLPGGSLVSDTYFMRTIKKFSTFTKSLSTLLKE